MWDFCLYPVSVSSQQLGLSAATNPVPASRALAEVLLIVTATVQLRMYSNPASWQKGDAFWLRWELPKIRGTAFGTPIIRITLATFGSPYSSKYHIRLEAYLQVNAVVLSPLPTSCPRQCKKAFRVSGLGSRVLPYFLNPESYSV